MLTNVMGLSRSRIGLALAIAVVAFAFSSASAQTVYTAGLSGPNEDPPNGSPATGTTTVTVDPVAHTIHIVVNFSGLVGLSTLAHIHAPTSVPNAGTASPATTTPTLPGFPAGVTFGSYDMVLFLDQASTYSTDFFNANGQSVAQAEAALLQALAEGRAYLNVHSETYPGGEIRGFLTTSVPVEDSTWGKVKSLYR